MAVRMYTQLYFFFFLRLKPLTFVTLEESHHWKMSYGYIQVQFIYSIKTEFSEPWKPAKAFAAWTLWCRFLLNGLPGV